MGRFISPDTIVPYPNDPQSFNRYAYARNNPIRYIDPTGHSWLSSLFKKIGNFFKDNWQAIVGGIAGAAIGGFMGWSFGVFMNEVVFAGKIISPLVGGLITGTEFAIGGFGAGVGSAIGAGGDIGDIFAAGGIGAAMGFGQGFAIGYSYTAGWQNVLHGVDTQAHNTQVIEQLKQQCASALKSGNLTKYSEFATQLQKLGVNAPKPHNILGVYRDSTIQGIYADNPVIYRKQDLDYNPFAFMNDTNTNPIPFSGILKSTGTGEAIGGARIVVYGIKGTMKPTSWIAYTRGTVGGIASTGWSKAGWIPVSERNAMNLMVTKEAEIYFYNK